VALPSLRRLHSIRERTMDAMKSGAAPQRDDGLLAEIRDEIHLRDAVEPTRPTPAALEGPEG
jgi:hypothetical protein